MIVYVFLVIICLISYRFLTDPSIGRNLIGFSIVIVALLFSTMWSIGYELSYTVKYDYYNIAYYETIDNGSILDTDATSVRSDTKKYHQHTIETYKIGEHYAPLPKEVPVLYITHKDNDFLNEPCYKVVLSNGQTGFILCGDVKTYFWEKSDFSESQQEKLRNIRWYGMLPSAMTSFCEGLFESFPLLLRYDLVSR